VARGVSYRYILSLPERVVRSLAAVSGGLLRELGEVVLPASLRRTKLYANLVDVGLRFLIAHVGEVEGIYKTDDTLAESILKRGAGHGIEIAGILAFHASPVWILAALADAAGGSRALISEISQALKEEKLLPPDARFETMEQVLDGLEKTSGTLAGALNLPPVDVAGLRREWNRLSESVKSLPPKNLPGLPSLERLWERMRESAREQNRSIFAVSSLMALSTIGHVPANLLWLSRATRSAARRTGKVLGEAVLDHYTHTLDEISATGFTAYWAQEFRPYLRAAARQFAPRHQSLTERLIGRKR
jgi:hypothetical protein